MRDDILPLINVGILESENPELELHGNFTVTGLPDGSVMHTPNDADAFFTVKDVVIGKKFHWERREDQSFRGSAVVMASPGGLKWVVNRIHVEEYLKSVISSEMSANASLELLKAHAVISRSWALRILDRENIKPYPSAPDPIQTAGLPEVSRWQDNDDHRLFDVCADDHCQRYQGITRQTNPAVVEAVEATRGMVLTYGGEICDARFSKCCGGVTERFSTCWQPVDVAYLRPVRDCDTSGTDFCDTADAAVLRQILNDYDRETPDFYRWEESFTPSELAENLRLRTGHDFGEIVELLPLERGASGRICRLLVRGTLRSEIIGKELEIRQSLSPKCLKSSWFDVEKRDGRFILHGRGWGHGVGLCQIGAAVMASRGYGYREILSHYYPGAQVESLY